MGRGGRTLDRAVGEAFEREDARGSASAAWLARRFGAQAAEVGSVLELEQRLAGAAAIAAALPGLRIVRAIGEGSTGRVYLAEPTAGGNAVAVKVLRPGLAASGRALARFLREVEAARRVRHPGVVSVLDARIVATPAGEVPVLVMRYVQGETLRERLDAKGPLAEAACRRIGAAVARALAAVHAAGVVHRDVKPANVLLARRGPMLLDLGSVRMLDVTTKLTSTGRFVGTLAYAAPEQLDPSLGAVDGRADLFALGATLFEATTGVVPPAGGGPRRPSDLCPELSRSFDDLVSALLEARAANRPGTAEAVAAALDPATATTRRVRLSRAATADVPPELGAVLAATRRGTGGVVVLASSRPARSSQVLGICAARAAERSPGARLLRVRWTGPGVRDATSDADWRESLRLLESPASGPAVLALERCHFADPMERAAIAALASAAATRPLVILATPAPHRGRRLYGDLAVLPHVRWVELDGPKA